MLKLMTKKLTRHGSTLSLPSQTERVKGTGKERLRQRLSYSLKRARGRVLRESNRLGGDSCNFQNNADSPHFQEIKNVHLEFEKFLNVVQDDLNNKLETLKKFKGNENVNLHDKSYASLQIFMLYKYADILRHFRSVSMKSANNICKNLGNKNQEKDEIQLVDQYKTILMKMKRRMKRMIDISEKYAVIEMFDTINMLTTASEDLNLSLSSEHDQHIRYTMSLGDLSQESSLGVEMSTRKTSHCSSSSSESSVVSSRRVSGNTFRSLTDHFSVLTKNYLNYV